ncbi:hypothetical protein ACQPXH_01675 [Nocardia sp. CA-135953]|uniref:hypothetical protein n=1 Tax=Nocardia sp. CA-135953 TaxID=3239978 RepID=UPI003D978079
MSAPTTATPAGELQSGPESCREKGREVDQSALPTHRDVPERTWGNRQKVLFR